MAKYDYNLVVIGAGSAGLVSSYIAAQINAKVALIEKDKMGGDCLNTGCVPSKALIKSAKIAALQNKANSYGFDSINIEYEFSNVMERIQKVIKKIEPHDSVERYTQLGVECINGAAKIISNTEVEVNGKTISTRAIIIATGARPLVPKIPGVDLITPLTSDNIWKIRDKPKRLVVLGGGPIGCELSQSFNRLGVEVSQVEMAPYLMPKEDEAVSQIITNKLKQEGVNVLTNYKAESFSVEGGIKKVNLRGLNNQTKVIEFDEVLFAIGRQPNTTGFGLDELGIELKPDGTIKVNEFMQTNIKNIFACGDIAGPYQFTHMAAHQAYYACVNALLRPFTRFIPPPFNKSFKVDYSVVPWATYTDPEVATVGLSERSAQQNKIAYEFTTYGIDDLDRAITEEEDHGTVRVLTAPGSDKILGVTIVAHNAGDLITEFISAMKHGYGLNSILATIHIYPTMSEANKFLAGNWKKKHKPVRLLSWVKKFFNYLRK